jgi:putative ABC transport system substrate-binding protein
MLLVAALAAPLAAEGQQSGTVYRFGFLAGSSAPSRLIRDIRDALAPLGYTEGQNLVIEARHADAKLERLPALAAELVALKVDLILTDGTPAARAAKQATTTIPIVFNLAADPVEQGLVDSLARPGGNLTGFAFGLYEDKQLEILKQAVPRLSRAACLCGGDPASWSSISDAARKLGVRLQFLDVRGPNDLDEAITTAANGRAEGLLVPNSQWLVNQLGRIADLAAKRKLAAVGFLRAFVELGGLLSYGPTPRQGIPRVAAQVDRILKGTKPADLPVERPTKFELAINLKTAKALGLTIPPAVLARADEIIQ